jgi:alanine dehydrogenase
MIIGCPKEVKDKEFRVGIVPSGVRDMTAAGHTVFVEKGAGTGSRIGDREYIDAGGTILETAEEVYSQSEMIIKVKEPVMDEFRFLREDLILFTFLHLAPLKELTEELLKSGVTGIGYETVQLESGYLPLLAPMSEVAGRMSVHIGAQMLKQENARGILLGGVPGVEHGKVVIIGGGIAGSNAARVAIALGAMVTILDIDIRRLEYLEDIFQGKINTLISNRQNIEDQLKAADLVVGAVLLPGRSAPRLVTKDMLMLMKRGSVIVDIAIDQGGCFDTSHPTTHTDPIYEVDGIIHYCVTNMPGAVPRTSTFALTNATMHFASEIALNGIIEAAKKSSAILSGINTFKGKLLNRDVAESQGLDWTDPREALGLKQG